MHFGSLPLKTLSSKQLQGHFYGTIKEKFKSNELCFKEIIGNTICERNIHASS